MSSLMNIPFFILLSRVFIPKQTQNHVHFVILYNNKSFTYQHYLSFNILQITILQNLFSTNSDNNNTHHLVNTNHSSNQAL